MFTPETSCLLIVDFQSRLAPALPGIRPALDNAIRLAKAARHLDVPVLATEQNARGIGETVDELKPLIERICPKMHFDATKEPGWPEFIPAGRPHIVVIGSETHVCVLQTAMGLLSRKHAVRVVSDAVASRTAQNRKAGLSRAAHYGAEIVTTEMVLFEWLQSCTHPRFRDVLALIK